MTQRNDRQQKGEALERLTYDTLKELLRSKLKADGQETETKNGTTWQSGDYTIFWNGHRVKDGEYPWLPKENRGPGKRLADLALKDNRIEPTKFDGKYVYPKAILAIECKNTNLDYKWTTAAMFDRDVMTRFLWGDINKILGMQYWEKYYSSFSNLYPNATKILVTPKFAYHPNALRVSFESKPLDGLAELMIKAEREAGLMPLTNSEKSKIEWRIARLRLQILELNYQPVPDKPTPEPVKQHLRAYLETELEKQESVLK